MKSLFAPLHSYSSRRRGALRYFFAPLLVALLFASFLSRTASAALGDLNNDGQVNVQDAIITLQIAVKLLENPTPEQLVAGDVNFDGGVTVQDTILILRAAVNIQPLPEPPALTQLLETSPANGETEVAVTRETKLRFTRPLAQNVTLNGDLLNATFAGNRLPARLHLSTDRKTLTLFYTSELPAGARVRVTLAADTLLDEKGKAVDANGDGKPGGTAVVDFETLPLTALAGTSVVGRVFASQLKPGSQESVNEPLAGVTITVDGQEETLRAVTDANGNFRLSPTPGGQFFVHIDGHTATNGMPAGAYYPVVGKLWQASPGAESNVGNIFLPLIPAGTLLPVSESQDTPIQVPDSVKQQNPAYASIRLIVPANSLFNEDGTRGGMVGVAPVPPDRIPSPLPQGLNIPLVVTIQATGTDFDRPAPMCFPNLDNPATPENEKLAAGAKSALWSFNHDIGYWENSGPMTVSADGAQVCSDEGFGVRQPGWHGPAPGTPGDGPPGPPSPPGDPPAGGGGGPGGPPPFPPCNDDLGDMSSQRAACAVGAGLRAGECTTKAIKKPGLGSIFAAISTYKCVKKAKEDGDKCRDHFNKCINDALGLYEAPIYRPLQADPTDPRVQALQDLNQSIADDLAAQASLITQMEAIIGTMVTEAQLTDSQKAQLEPLIAQLNRLMGDKSQAEFFGPRNERINGLVSEIGKSLNLFSRAEAFYSLEAGEFSPEGVFVPNPNVPVERGRTGVGGAMVRLILRADTAYRLRRLFPDTLGFGEVEFRSASSGFNTAIPRGVTLSDLAADTDSDGLTDTREFAVGTDPNKKDTDGDSFSDLVEIRQGTNPLDGMPSRTGIIAAARTPGPAVDVATLNDLAAVAGGNAVSVFNIFNAMEPKIIAQVNTPGPAQSVALARGRIAVANGGNLSVIDITDPPAAKITHTLSATQLGGNAVAVAAAGATAYVALESRKVVSVDMANGQVTPQVELGEGKVQDISIGGDTLYVLTTTALHALPLSEATLRVAGSAGAPPDAEPIPRMRLFIGDGIAYVTTMKGYSTYSLESPLQPRGITTGLTPQFGWKHVVANGSGTGALAIAATGPNRSDDGPHNVSLYGAGTPAQTDNFLSTYETPGIATAVSIYNGQAYIADRDGGLQVLNYLAFDNKGVAPEIALSTNFSENRAEEGKFLRVTAKATDDVQVRNVEFYVDGERAETDGNFPFEFRHRVPLLKTQTTFRLKARVSDTGGNAVWTPERIVTIVKDATPPTVTGVTPKPGTGLNGSTQITATFNEAMDPATLTGDSFQLFAEGPDRIIGTADDTAVAGTVTYRADDKTAVLTLGNAPASGALRAVVKRTVTDTGGNPLAKEFSWTFWSRQWDPAPEFSTASNPNGPWTYGQIAAAGAAFQPYTTGGKTAEGLDSWNSPDLGGASASVVYNATSQTIRCNCGTATYQPGDLVLHPGNTGASSVVRWTAPAAGTFDLDALFTGYDHGSAPTTDVHVLHNGTSIYDGNVFGYLHTVGITRKTVTVQAGDTLDFVVGWGSNGNYNYDSTRLQVSLMPSVGYVYQPVDLSLFYNSRHSDLSGGLPKGSTVLGGIPFDLPVSGNDHWTSSLVPGPNPRTLDVPVNLSGVTEVHTLINTGWGKPGPESYASLEFFGSNGAYFKKDLVGNQDIRDWSQWSFTNGINGTSTFGVLYRGSHRVDKQRVALPPEFIGQRLERIRLTDNGAENFQRAFMAGLTVGRFRGNEPPAPRKQFHSVDFSTVHNANLHSGVVSGVPLGQTTLGGVPFAIPTAEQNIWHSHAATGDNPRFIDIPVGKAGITEAHTLIGNYWGRGGPESYASVEFFGSGGAYYKKDLIGNVDIRDHLSGSYTNNLNGTSSIVVLNNGGRRLDKKKMVLPPEFATQTLEKVRVSDNGAQNLQRIFLAGLTVAGFDPSVPDSIRFSTTVPVPAGSSQTLPPVVDTNLNATAGQAFDLTAYGAIDLRNSGPHIWNNAAGVLVEDATEGYKSISVTREGGFPKDSLNPVASTVHEAAPLGPALLGALLIGQIDPANPSKLLNPQPVFTNGTGLGPLSTRLTLNFAGKIGFQVNEGFATNNSGAFNVNIRPAAP
ncbi:MAG: Ig-like domain-containing protein [Armatimonadetes bacterium]|nr:Ig-like domain-containing protein [Armatimonadota bacterium]